MNVTTHRAIDGLDEKLSRKTVTTGCGQGAMYGDMMAGLHRTNLQAPILKQSHVYEVLAALKRNDVAFKFGDGNINDWCVHRQLRHGRPLSKQGQG